VKRTQWRFGFLASTLMCVAPLSAFGQDVGNDDPILSGPMLRGISVDRGTTGSSFLNPREDVLVPVSNEDLGEAEAGVPGTMLTGAQEAPMTAPAPAADPYGTAPGGPAAYCTGNNGVCCNGGSYCCAPCYTVIASAEATFFWPQFSRGFLSTGVNNGVNGLQTTTTNTNLGSVAGNMLVAPRITLGVQGECWGIVGRYWNAQSWASGFTPAVANSGIPGVTSFDGFRAYTLDLEVQRRFCFCNWTAYGFGGIRYASIQNTRSLQIIDNSGANVFLASSYAMQQFSGTGITFGGMGTIPICPCDPCCPWSLYVANRYSILWGNAGVTSQTNATMDTTGFASSTNGAFTSKAGSLFIAEIQAGLQWNAELRCLPGRRAFLRAGGEFQYWNTASNLGASAFSVAGNTAAQGTAANSSVGNMLFSLVGFTVGTGIMY